MEPMLYTRGRGERTKCNSARVLLGPKQRASGVVVATTSSSDTDFDGGYYDGWEEEERELQRTTA